MFAYMTSLDTSSHIGHTLSVNVHQLIETKLSVPSLSESLPRPGAAGPEAGDEPGPGDDQEPRITHITHIRGIIPGRYFPSYVLIQIVVSVNIFNLSALSV